MAVLKIDLDILDRTITAYTNAISDFKTSKRDIRNSLINLRSSGWDSGASRAWFSLLDDEWLKNIDFQIRVLERLRDNLYIAKTEYSAVESAQTLLGNRL